MNIEEIIDFKSKKPDEIIAALKVKDVSIPSWADLEKEYNPLKHPVMDKTKYPDIIVEQEKVIEVDGIPTKVKETVGLEEVTRITYDLQKLAVKRINSLCFGIPVKRVYSFDEGDERMKYVADVMERIFKKARIDSFNLDRGKQYFASCEVMTLWFAVQKQNSYYGVDSPIYLRCITYSPMKGDSLYPLFDEYGDLIALSVEYKRTQGGKELSYFDTYTADKHIKFVRKDSWELVEENEIKEIGKIPAVYMSRPLPAWEESSNIVYEMEWSMSRNGNYIRENSRPLFVVFADEEIPFGNEPMSNNTGKGVLKYPKGSSANYVTWNQSTDALKFHNLELRQQFFTQLQLPDWSFENMKSVAMSGESMKQMFIDAIMKTREESGVLIEALDREVNIVKAFMKHILSGYDKEIDALDVENVITPCTVDESSDATEEQSGEHKDGLQKETNQPVNA